MAWSSLFLNWEPPYVVEPIRAPDVVRLLDYIDEGGNSGERWTVSLTNLEAEQTITWYLKQFPQIPFAHPKVTITPDYVAAEGDAVIGGLRMRVGGSGRVIINNEGLPEVELIELSIPVPNAIKRGIEQELRRQLRRAEDLPVRFSDAEWSDGSVVVTGYIR